MRQGEQGDLIDALTTDHLVLKGIFSTLETDARDPRRRRELVDAMRAELARHSAVKERLLYPLVHEGLSHGSLLVEKELRDHQETLELLERLDGHEPGEEEFEATLRKLVESVRSQIEQEEQVLYSAVGEVCDPERLRWIGTQIAEARNSADVPQSAAPGGILPSASG